jgi:hypothetical protein
MIYIGSKSKFWYYKLQPQLRNTYFFTCNLVLENLLIKWHCNRRFYLELKLINSAALGTMNLDYKFQGVFFLMWCAKHEIFYTIYRKRRHASWKKVGWSWNLTSDGFGSWWKLRSNFNEDMSPKTWMHLHTRISKTVEFEGGIVEGRLLLVPETYRWDHLDSF